MDNLVQESVSSIPSVDVSLMRAEAVAEREGPRVSVDQLLLAGAHFGHITQRWNPKMKRYIFMARSGIYLIDLQKTQAMIETACRTVAKIANSGEEILFVGTKKQARDIIETEAKRASSPYVTYRWLGGMLTNFATIRRSLKTLESYERMSADGTYDKLTKKEQLSIEKARQKLSRNLGGIRDMRRLPGAVFIVDTQREAIAVAEARKLGIPIFAIVDTNADPDLINYPIPANDDAFKSIWLIAHAFGDAVLEGKKLYQDSVAPQVEEAPPPAERRSRRSRRRRSGSRRSGKAQKGSSAAGNAVKENR